MAGVQRYRQLLQHLAAAGALAAAYLHAQLPLVPVKDKHAKGRHLDKAALALYPQT